MDISALSKGMTQPMIQERADKVVMKTTMDTEKENDDPMIERPH
jgi:hypothetical protein